MKRVKFLSQIFSQEGSHLTVTSSSWCSLSVFLRVVMRGALSFIVLVVPREVVWRVLSSCLSSWCCRRAGCRCRVRHLQGEGFNDRGSRRFGFKERPFKALQDLHLEKKREVIKSILMLYYYYCNTCPLLQENDKGYSSFVLLEYSGHTMRVNRLESSGLHNIREKVSCRKIHH